MAATFKASGSFELIQRRLFVVHGTIESGTVKKGMTMKLGMNSSFSLVMLIDSIEFLD